MTSRFVSVTLIASMLGLSSAMAASNLAEIGLIQGKVLVNQGKGFVALIDGAALKAGDRVMVGKDSSAQISYNNGCAVSVNSASVVTVASVAPCDAGQFVAASSSNLIAPVAAPAASITIPLVTLGVTTAVVAAALVVSNKSVSP